MAEGEAIVVGLGREHGREGRQTSHRDHLERANPLLQEC